VSSGATVDDDCVTKFEDLKLHPSYRYIIFTVNATRTSIIVEKTSTDDDSDALLADLPENDCRRAVYNIDYPTVSGDILLFLVCREGAEVIAVRR
jgi:cofilin